MDAELYQRAQELLAEVLDAPRSERELLLKERCGDDDELHAATLRLLAAIDTDDDWFEQKAIGPLVRAAVEDIDTEVETARLPERIGRYVVEAEIGRGGMGVVWRGRDVSLDRPVALKALAGHGLEEEEAVARFRREARMLAAIRHPNVATIYGVEEHEGHLVLVLELLEGRRLSDCLARDTFPMRESLRIAEQVAAALAEAHRLGIIHRDLNPNNIHVDDALRARVLDFGLARPVSTRDAITNCPIVAGTPGYMSPQQVAGEAVDARSDVWALGCVIYELMTGVRAFPGSSAAEKMERTLAGQLDWSALPAETPSFVRHLLEACLAERPEHRPADASGVQRALERALHEDSAATLTDAAAETATPTDGNQLKPVRGGRIGPYSLDHEIGRGGGGVVWHATDLRLDRPVAIKTLAEHLLRRPANLAAFESEARLLASLNHPHLATIFDLPMHEGQPVLVMELLDGRSLARRLDEEPLGIRKTLELGAQVASGLAAAHEKGIVHRDLKPRNIQLLASGAAKILDFGIAGTGHGKTPTAEGSPIGTLGYMSPEQVLDEDVDARSDLFSLGLVLFECVTGRPVFEGASTEALLSATLAAEPDWTLLPDGLPESVRRVLRSCLSKDRAQRPASAREVEAALTDALRQLDSPDGRGSARAASTVPTERDEFVGREQELGELTRLLDSGKRLVSVLGPGGTGKTRLALRHAANRAPSLPGGTWFCDLSEARDREGIARAVAAGLRLPITGSTDPIVRLGEALADRGRCLVVLDNFEQVVDHASDTVGEWMSATTQARFVITSRAPLELPDETQLRIEPLEPTAGLELFELRARARRPDVMVDAESAALAEEIVRLVDGLPLAIELAAARVRLLSLDQILDRMKDRFRLLSAPRGTSSGRQRALRSTIEWSWDLLSPWEQSALAQLSVFEGGCTLEAAEAVLDLTPWEDAPWTLDVLQSLVDRSLLTGRAHSTAGQKSGELRFSLYLSIQEFAAERLRGEAAEQAVHVRHGEHFASLGSRNALASLSRHGGSKRRSRLESELDNILAACRRAIARGDAGMAVDSLAAAGELLNVQGPIVTAIELGEAVLAMEELDDAQRARAQHLASRSLVQAGRVEESMDLVRSALTAHRELGDRTQECSDLRLLAHGLSHVGVTNEARELLESALSIARELGDPCAEADALGELGLVARQEDRNEEARKLMENSLAGHRKVGDRASEGTLTANLGLFHLDAGRKPEARQHFQEALAIHREVGNRANEGICLGNLGQAAEDPERARAYYEEALAIHRELGFRRGQGYWLSGLGRLANDRGDLAEAIALGRQAVEVAQAHPTTQVIFRRNLALSLVAAGDLGAAEEELEHLESLDVSFLRVDVACLRGEILLARGDRAGALAARDEAAALLESQDEPDAPVVAILEALDEKLKGQA